jgi:two-component system NtrC family response regulator
MAQGGTLFLDEIGEMLPKTQVNLLRVLEQREVRRVGGEADIPLDVRLVAATHRDVEELVSGGKLREDLFYRLNVVPVRVPPVRGRRDDIPTLVEHFLAGASVRHRREPKVVAGAAMRILCDYSWPGNVRQLRNCMERLAVTVEGPVIHAPDLPPELQSAPRQGLATLEEAVQEAERGAILAALEHCNHHRERTARVLGISIRTLQYRMKCLSLQ